MNEGRPYLRTWRGVWVYFCKIAIVSFISVRYKSDGLYCRMAGTPSKPTLFFYRSREKDEQGKALFANMERGVGIFLQNCHSFLPIR